MKSTKNKVENDNVNENNDKVTDKEFINMVTSTTDEFFPNQ